MQPIIAEKIIQIRRQEKEPQEDLIQTENNIDNGYVIIKYEKVRLQEKAVLGGKAVMLLPQDLEPMDESLMLIKYPDADRPECIYSDEEGAVTLTMHFEEGELDEWELEQISDILETQMKRMYPAAAIEEKEIIGKGKKRICWFSLDIPLIDDLCCHTMFFRAFSNGIIMGTFDCEADVKKQWKPVIRQLLETIEEISGQEEKERENGDIKGMGFI